MAVRPVPCSTKASGERRRGLRHSALSARHLGGVARQELVHGLAGVQPRDRGQHTESIAREEDDIVGVPRHTVLLEVGYVKQRVRHAAVLSLGRVRVVWRVVGGLQEVVFEERIFLDRAVNFRLRLL